MQEYYRCLKIKKFINNLFKSLIYIPDLDFIKDIVIILKLINIYLHRNINIILISRII